MPPRTVGKGSRPVGKGSRPGAVEIEEKSSPILRGSPSLLGQRSVASSSTTISFPGCPVEARLTDIAKPIANMENLARSSRGRALVAPVRFRDDASFIGASVSCHLESHEQLKQKVVSMGKVEVLCDGNPQGVRENGSPSMSKRSSGSSSDPGMLNQASPQQKLNPKTRPVTCLFDLCHLKLRQELQAHRDHIHHHILHSREWCLSGVRLISLIDFLRLDGLWLCSKCCRSYILRRSCACGFRFNGDIMFPIRIADDHPLPSSSSLPSSSPVSDAEAPSNEPSLSFAEDPIIFSLLRKNQ